MSQHLNPFLRGYLNLHINRMLVITYEDDCPPAWRPLHPSQASLSDEEVARFPCIFCDDFALITEDRQIPGDLETQCQSEGIVRTVVYAIYDGATDQAVHVGDTYSQTAARKVVRQLSFETGHYSRCWEISSAHLTADAMRSLAELEEADTPPGLLFVPFHIPGSPAIGVKLIATPWTSANLQHIEGISAEQLRQEHLDKGLPESLVETLHQAALADVRILVFDADAPTLEGLPLYDA